eukprot:CAMPEP_0172394238 /NCGR_PEP_ID=MMETSP1061-20121228/14173_1 /TAXON_ID=37318 /ORGANISM="Pseudo-nitzschia pungens, Strain cf. pungens" /LENGTH=108 /DNA_ID=CAMNT_0013125549 /DNA_START=72 /DNA_END=398 /DNA_ORIENTATION=+
MDMETAIREKMTELPPQDFEGVLHPAFEEDEIQLILLGGFLGALAGALQLLCFDICPSAKERATTTAARRVLANSESTEIYCSSAIAYTQILQDTPLKVQRNRSIGRA